MATRLLKIETQSLSFCSAAQLWTRKEKVARFSVVIFRFRVFGDFLVKSLRDNKFIVCQTLGAHFIAILSNTLEKFFFLIIKNIF